MTAPIASSPGESVGGQNPRPKKTCATIAQHVSAWRVGQFSAGALIKDRHGRLSATLAMMAYGPTYGQALTGFNFDGGQFDWFYALFTPLADVVVAFGAESGNANAADAIQVIAAMGWGTNENFKNLGEAADLSQVSHLEKFKGVDRQGAGILPRATDSWSATQFQLLAQAQGYKKASGKSLTVASHFTIVSFDEPQPYSNVTKKPIHSRFWPHNSATGLPDMEAGFNQVNVGTCERGLADYFEGYVRAGRRKPKGDAQVDWHLSGHSHRSGVYQAEWRSDGPSAQPYVQIVSAKDPGIHLTQTVPADTQTALIVSSCGGPVGYQNLDGELSAWTGRPPAGTLLDPVTGKISQVSTSRCRIEDGKAFNEKPRLAVALDYLHVMNGLPEKGNIDKPLEFAEISQFAVGNTQIPLRLSRQMKKLNCIESLTLWVFEVGKDAAGDDIRKWHRIDTTLDKPGSPSSATVHTEGMTALAGAFAAGVVGRQTNSSFRRIQASFCEVGLRKPGPTDAGEDWAKDMQCSDPWVFPISIVSTNGGKSISGLGRVAGEKGEVPDWKWLSKAFADKGYIPPEVAVAGKASVSTTSKP